MSAQRVPDEKVAEMRRRVQMSFKELRRMGFIAKSNFACCMSCAVAELQEIGNEKRRNKAVYWHRQDEEAFRESGLLCIRYCYIPAKSIEGDTSCVEHHIGEQVEMALRKAGLEIQWDGNPGKVIEVVGLAEQPTPEKEDTNGSGT
jgi:hypothetical protein